MLHAVCLLILFVSIFRFEVGMSALDVPFIISFCFYIDFIA